MPARGSQTGFQPLTSANASDIMDGIAADIDGRLAGYGFSVPVTSPATATEYLLSVNVWGAVAEIQKAQFRSGTGPNTEGAWAFYEKRYRDALAGLRDWAEGVLGVGTGIMPGSYTLRYPDEDVSQGANADSLMSVKMQW